MSLLAHYGLDLPGAVQIVSQDTKEEFLNQAGNYIAVTEEEIGQHLREMRDAEAKHMLDTQRSWARQDESWSLGGNQAKWALRLFNGQWYTCHGSGASNKIVKPGVFGMDGQALAECVSMRLAKNIGLDVADVEIVRFGDVNYPV